MKVVILAGGRGTRISEESNFRPKPMIDIGGMPIMWHIMKEYSYYGFNEFVICAGYRQQFIKDWFGDYFRRVSDVTFDYTHGKNEVTVHEAHVEPWRVTIVDLLTYGDAVCDVNIADTVRFHEDHRKTATLTAVLQDQSKGVLDIGEDDTVKAFREKNITDQVPINAGYMVFEPQIFDYLKGDGTVLEREPLQRLAEEGELMSYRHKGFWQCMDNMREKEILEKRIRLHKAPWIKWPY